MSPDVLSDAKASVVIGGAFLVLLSSAELWSRKGNAKPEWTRKLVHFGGGLLCLSFPWAIRSPWFVLGLALINSLIIVVGRRTNTLQCLHKVTRTTAGSEYYPASIFLVFLITYGRPWLYVSSVLVLAVADAFAALIGGRYGSITYNVEDSDKSLEGSMVFMVIAFLAMHLPMLLLTDLPRETCVLAALLVSVLVTGFEAISLKGTDNIFIPLAVSVILFKITSKPVAEILYQVLSLLVISAGISITAYKAKSFNVGGTIVFLLFTYGAWSLGSEIWALPVFVGFIVYTSMWLVLPPNEDGRTSVKVRTVFHAVLPALVVLLVGNLYKLESFLYGPFAVCCATVLAISAWNHLVWHKCGSCEKRNPAASGVVGILAAAVIILPPMLLLNSFSLREFAVSAALTAVLSMLHDVLMPRPFDTDHVWTCCRLMLSAGAAIAMVLLQYLGIARAWY